MQFSLSSEDRAGPPELVPKSAALSASRQSVRLIDFSREVPPRADLALSACAPPSPAAIIDAPFNPQSLEHLPAALLDVSSSTESTGGTARDPFDLRHLMPPAPAGPGSSFRSTPSLPIAVAAGAERPLTPDLSSSSTEHGPASPMSVRLSSSADSALDPQATAGRLPPGGDADEGSGCGCSDHPRLPPRAPSGPGARGDRPRILPILENGQRTSYTHYWVIPPPTSAAQRLRLLAGPSPGAPDPPPAATAPPGEGYVNVGGGGGGSGPVTRSVSMPPRVRPKERRYVKRSSGDADAEACGGPGALNRAFVDETATEEAPEEETPPPPALSASQPAPQLARSAARPSTEARNAMMVRVRESVHGVTDEEAIMILQTHRWDVERAVRILKIEQLFRLGVTPVKATCIKFLDQAGGDLERASARLLKAFSVSPTGPGPASASPSPPPQPPPPPPPPPALRHEHRYPAGSETGTHPLRRPYPP